MSTQTAQRVDDTAAWMANRNREVGARGRDAEMAGYAAYGQAARTGARFSAPRSSDVITVGARQLAAARPTPNNDFNEFRRQQAEFTKLQHEEQRRNAWLAIPALAPVVAVAGAEAAGWLATRALGRLPWQNPKGLPLDLPALPKLPKPRGGDTVYTQAGRRAHEALKQRVLLKPGWRPELEMTGSSGRILKPDVVAPVRNSVKPNTRYQMELKPNTPTGRRAGVQQAKKYEGETGNKTRPIHYDPKDYL